MSLNIAYAIGQSEHDILISKFQMDVIEFDSIILLLIKVMLSVVVVL